MMDDDALASRAGIVWDRNPSPQQEDARRDCLALLAALHRGDAEAGNVIIRNGNTAWMTAMLSTMLAQLMDAAGLDAGELQRDFLEGLL